MATLPMQAPDLAAQELQRAMRKLGLVGCQIGSNINGKNLDDPSLGPFWQMANALGAFIMVHPTQVAGADRLKNYYLANLIGNPLDTTIAAASLVFGGIVETYREIRFYMVHGGGFAPYQAGRWEHGWHVRPEPKVHLKEPPMASIKRLFFDTILHGRPALEFLVATFGPPQVMLGSDYPYDMGTLECVRQVRALPIPEPDRATILGPPGVDPAARRPHPGQPARSRRVLADVARIERSEIRDSLPQRPRISLASLRSSRATPRHMSIATHAPATVEQDPEARRVLVPALHAFTAEVLRAVGLPAADAEIVAEYSVATDLAGADAHGIFRLPHYVRRLRAGGVNMRPNIR